jgi:hypothetical protein
MAPESVTKGKPLRLVITHHGAGSSENMFFDDIAAKVSGNNVAAPAER